MIDDCGLTIDDWRLMTLQYAAINRQSKI